MAVFLIDVNLPYRFSLWAEPEYVHVKDLGETWTDSQIWQYAQTHGLTIVSKDADFSERMMLHEPPPRVIHIRFGNLKMREFHQILSALWPDVREFSRQHKLVQVYQDRLEGID
jgi:predicted nuclease of predicted toxin-antitoxin system